MGLFFAMIAGIVAIVAAARARRRRVEHGWLAVATRLGLRWVPRSASGTIDGLHVDASVVKRGTGNDRHDATRVVVSGLYLRRGLGITSEDMFAKIKKLLGAQDVLLGDPTFDRLVHLQGDEVTVVACLDVALRRSLAALFALAPDAEITPEGDVVLEQDGIASPDRLESVVRALLAVARGLEVQGLDLAGLLARNALHDPVPAVRRRNLELLLRDFAAAPDAARAVDGALADADPRVRLVAARAKAGPEGFDALRGLVEGAPDPDLRLAALTTLLETRSWDESAAVLDGVLRLGRPQLRIVALDAITRRRDSTRLDAVLRMATHDDPPLSAATARTLGRIGDARAEPRLLELLAHPAADVRTEAARALGRVGTVASVEALLDQAKGLTTPGALKEAARDAVRRIQARAGNVDAGGLSLAVDAPTDGALSVAREGGELAVADEPSPDASPWSKGRRERG